MNRVFRTIWNEASKTVVVVSEIAKTRGKVKAARPKRLRLRLVATVLTASVALAPTAYAQQCSISATGGIVAGTTVANGCTITGAASTVSLTGTGRFEGWINFTGANSSMIIDAGGEFITSNAAAGNGTFSSISANASGWGLRNGGVISTSIASSWDLIGIRAAGTYAITNTGSIINRSTTAGSNVIESTLAGVTLQLDNSGLISSEGNTAVNLSGNGAYTVNNLAGGTIAGTGPTVMFVGSGTLSIVNRGTLRAEGGGTALNSGAATVLRNSGSITNGSAASQVMLFGANNDTLTLEPTSNITGYVSAGGGSDTLVLAGTGDGSFDMGALGPAQQYRLFETFEKREAGNWTLTGSSTAQNQSWRVFQGGLQLAPGATLEQASSIETVDDSSGGLTTIRISGALAGTGTGITLSNPFNANSLILDAGATFGARTLLLTNGVTYLSGPTVFPNDVVITDGYFTVGDGGVGTGGYISGNVANSGFLIFNHADDIIYGGAVSGTGTLVQQGSGILSLTGTNTQIGDTIVTGTLHVGDGGTTGSLAGNVNNSGTLAFNRSDAFSFGGAITGAGGVSHLGTGTTTLTNTGSSVGNVQVIAGTLALAQSGVFNASAFTTDGGATTRLATGATLAVAGAFTQAASSTLDVALGSSSSVISAASATLGGALNVTGFSAALPFSASALGATQANVIHTSGGITGDFASVDLNGSASPVDYLVLAGAKSADALDYNVGYGLTWLAGATQGNGIFTLANAADTFNVDVALANKTASGTGWDGTTLTKNGAGTLLLSAVNTYTGPTLLNAGVLRTGVANAFAPSSAVTVAGGATLELNNFDQTATNLAGAGTVALGSGVLTANITTDTSFDGVINGSGGLVKSGASAWVLTGNSGAFTGNTSILSGRLQVDGTLGAAGSTLTVSSGSTLGGHGTIGGNVSITDGILAPGTSPGTLTIAGDLALTGASVLNYEFGQAGAVGGALNDLTAVGGNLTLDGTLNVATAAGGSYGPGLYRVINYAGSLTDNGLVIGTAPSTDHFIQTSVANQVNLINTAGLTLNYWDGAAGPRNNNVINGGSGTWQSTTGNDNWTTVDGAVNAPYSDASFAVFSSAPGTVTVDTGLGAVTASGMQFASDGYLVQGGPIALVETDSAIPGITTVRVGDGTVAGAGHVATITSVLDGTVRIDKTDLGTLVLGGANTYTGGTTISGGTMSVGTDANLGAAAGTLEINGGTLETSAGFILSRAITIAAGNGSIQTDAGTTLTSSGQVSGVGSLTKLGSGTLLMTANNTWSGGTTITEGTLQLGTTVSLTGSLTGDVTNNARLALGHGNAWTFAGTVSGTGHLEQVGAGTTTLTADNTYTGGTTISAGTLRLGNGGTTGSLVGNVTNNAALVFNRSNALSYGGTLTGSGSLTQAGTGTTTLTGAGSTVGNASVTTGVLNLDNAGVFTATGDYATGAGATTQIAADTTLSVGGAFSQAATATLAVALGGSQPVISAATASLGGTLNITGFGAAAPTTASALTATHFTVIHTTGGISNDFTSVDLGSASSPVDYLTLSGERSADTLDYNVGLRLTWLAGATTGNGVFTLPAVGDTFNVDVALADQAPAGTGWDGTTLTKAGAGTLILSAANTYTGPTLITAGTLQAGIADAFASSGRVEVASGATLDLNGFNQTANNLSGAGNVALGSGALTVNDSTDTTFAGVISGSGSLTKAGTGTLTLTGSNAPAGGTTITDGTLQIGDGGTTGSIEGNVIDNGTLAFNRSDTVAFDGSISGTGLLNQIGTGTTQLTGDSSAFAGTTQVSNGVLRVDGILGSAGSAMTVATGGTIGGNGTIGGDVSIADGILAPGASPGTLTINGDLALSAASILNYELGEANVVGGALDDLTIVGGDLTLDGTLNVAAPSGGTFGPGLYRVISYGGALTDNGLDLGNLPPGQDVFVQTGFAGQVNLVNTTGLTLNYWDGPGPRFDGVINGGTGIWQATAGNDNWSDATGTLNASYTDGAFAIFGGTAGTVTVDDSVGPITASGMQFATSGYVIDGDAITLLAGPNVLRVGDGTVAGAGFEATIGAELTGTGGVDKTDAGTLVLTAANTYSGGTTISAGTLQIGDGGSTGAITGDVVDNGTLAFNRADAVTFAGAISGTGQLLQMGTGTTTLTNTNTYSGGTTLTAGTLQLGDGVSAGSIVGGVVNDATLAFNNPTDTTFEGDISGSGNLVTSGTSVLTLTGANSYTGGTAITAGTLQIGDGGTQGSITGDVMNSGVLVFNRSDALSFSGAISGGTLVQAGAGTTTLDSVGSSVASTRVDAGTLDLAQAGSFATDSFTTATGATTHIAADATLAASDAFVQEAGSLLAIELGSTQPVITAATASLGGSLDITGFGADLPNTASALTSTQFNVIHTTGGISNDFSFVELGAAGGNLDFLTLAGAVSADALDYNVGFGLTWLAGPTSGNGVFTLLDAADTFDVDVALGDQAPSSTGWDGTTLTKNGEGTLVLSALNTYTGPTLINGGILRAGIADAFATSSAVNVASGATLDLDGFDQTARNLAGAGNVTLGGAGLTVQSDVGTVFSGSISGEGSLTKKGAATLTLSGGNTYGGATLVEAGTLKAGAQNAFSATSAHTVAGGGTLDTGGFNQTVAALDNGGTVRLLGTTPGSTLTVTGAYVGRSGTLQLGTRLGDSGSPSDRLVLDGAGASASGSSRLEITNLGGLGAPTSGNGIEVVSALNGATSTAQTTKDAFVLAGGSAIAAASVAGVTLQGAHIDAGAYEYQLYAADINGLGENWYLRSTSTTPVPPDVPSYRAEVPMFASLPSQVRQSELAMLGNLHLRVGDESESSAVGSSGDARERRAWARVVYSDLDIRQSGTVTPRSKGHTGGVQVGTDMWADSAWRAGVYLGYLRGSGDISGDARGTYGRVGYSDSRSSTLGGYATWLRADGLYTDAVVQGTRHRYTLHPDFNPSASGKASSLTGSLEAGMPFKLSKTWSLEPQLQVIYQRNDLDDVQISGATVQQDADDGWIGRLGVRLKADLATAGGQLQAYGRANLYYGSPGTDVARFIAPAAVTPIASRTGYTSTELAAGLTLTVNKHASLYGELGHLYDNAGDARVRSSVLGSLGIRLSW